MTFRVLALALLALGGAFPLLADGDSKDCLLTPERYDDQREIVENTPTSTLTLASPYCVKTPSERDGWGDGGAKGCYARRDGVGLRKAEESALQKTLECPEFISYVAVTVMAATKGAAGDGELTLSLRLRDDLAPEAQTFSFNGAQNSPKTLVFTFEESVEAAYLRLTNLDEKNVFEVSRVVWRSRVPGISGELQTPTSVLAGKGFRCSIGNLSGGSGTYVRARFEFAGQSVTQEPILPGGTVDFAAPETDGVYPITVTVWDDLGVSAVFSAEIHVEAYAPPRNLRATETSRTGFTLEWDIGPLSPDEYRVRVEGSPAQETFSPLFRPVWEETAGGRFVTSAALGPLTPWTQGEKTSGFLQTPAWDGTLEFSFDGAEWRPFLSLDGLWLSFTLPASARQSLWLRAAAPTPPKTVRLWLTVSRVRERVIKAADGQRRAVSFLGLPAGRPVQAVVSACYPRADGGAITVDSEPLTVTLEPIPAFRKAEWAEGAVELTWPEGTEGLSGEIVLWAERDVPHALPPGLYLTRTCFTASKADGQGTGFSAGKGFVLSNTSEAPIPLDGKDYALAYAKIDGSGSARRWDFGVMGEEGRTYPYVVPAGEELAFSSATYPIPEVREGVASSSAVPNITPEYTLTLMRGTTAVNTLNCATNAVRRLREDTLSAYDDCALTAAAPDMSPFYDAWTRLSEEEFCGTMGLAHPGVAGGVSVLCLSPEAFVGDMGGVRRIWAECVILDGTSRSEPLTVELWRRANDSPASARGFRLRLR